MDDPPTPFSPLPFSFDGSLSLISCDTTPISATDDQFPLRIQDKGNTYTPLDSFFFQSVFRIIFFTQI